MKASSKEMLGFLLKYRLHSIPPDPNLLRNVGFVQYPHLKSFSTISKPSHPTNFTLDYLINTCGLSPQTALSASQKITIKSPDKPNSVLNFFKTHGFSNTHITQIVTKFPQLLHANPNKTLIPKFKFLQSLGFSGPNLANFISLDPQFLSVPMSDQLLASLGYLKGFFPANPEVVTVIMKRSTWVLRCNLEKKMGPNIAILRDLAVPESNISNFVMQFPRQMMLDTQRFKDAVDGARTLGFEPSSLMFVHAVRIIATSNKSLWERRLAVYKEFGFSKDETLAMFRKQPKCMNLSEKKLRKGMDFFMNVLKWKPLDMSSSTLFLSHSLEKRVIPRCAVLEVLSLAGAIRRIPIKKALQISEKEFMDGYVIGYGESIPDVVKAYNGEIEFAGFRKDGLLK